MGCPLNTAAVTSKQADLPYLLKRCEKSFLVVALKTAAINGEQTDLTFGSEESITCIGCFSTDCSSILKCNFNYYSIK